MGQGLATRASLTQGGLGPLGVLSRAGGLSVLAAVGASVAIGTLVVVAPIAAIAGVLLTMAAIVAWTRPALAIAACLVAASLHRGLFLYLRVEPGGYPLSVFDAVPVLLLFASVSLSVKARGSAPGGRTPVAVCGAMIVAGLLIGVTLGTSQGADSYDLLQVLRLEALTLVVLVSALVAGHTSEWRRAVLAGLMGAAVSVAVQLIVTFGWSLATGTYFWSLFPFGASIDDLLGKVQAGNILTLRENAISAFLILPALALLIRRSKGWDIGVAMLLVAGGLLWLSRGLWLAMALTLLIALAHRATSGRLTGGRLLTIALPVTAVVLAVFLASGGILGQRLGDTTKLSGDKSLELRGTETQASLKALGEGVGPLLFGLGSGVVASPEQPSALLENSVLATWTNIGLLGLLGVTLLFFGAALRGWRLASRGDDSHAAALGAMSLALPVLWLQGLIGGTFRVEQSTVMLFLLAATVLVTPKGVRRSASQAQGSLRREFKAV